VLTAFVCLNSARTFDGRELGPSTFFTEILFHFPSLSPPLYPSLSPTSLINQQAAAQRPAYPMILPRIACNLRAKKAALKRIGIRFGNSPAASAAKFPRWKKYKFLMPICRLASDAPSLSLLLHLHACHCHRHLSLGPSSRPSPSAVLLLLWPTFVVVLLFVCFCVSGRVWTKKRKGNKKNDGQRQKENIDQPKKYEKRKENGRENAKKPRKRLIFARLSLQCNFFCWNANRISNLPSFRYRVP